MRSLKAWLYVTLDGVVEAPEDWVVPDEQMFEEQTADYATSDALLLGAGHTRPSPPRGLSGEAMFRMPSG
jgi:hypothetical protein